VVERSCKQFTASEDDDVPSRLNPWDQRAQCFSNAAFGTIALDGFTQGTPGGHAEAGTIEIVGVSYQHEKRVRIRLSHSPHPLEVGRFGQAEPALHRFALEPDFPPNCVESLALPVGLLDVVIRLGS
jgi:hypothetical protein